ncbi:unnamed protein product [Adineta ricciae]|uniref:NAD(P)(+)--arginine ADP-ribosyltransferase n=1 Tax=Adineta ricciae TaxID=249248 RepID=A0A815PVR1_ADIRI|nr:unnamed protein product [Adineta ricciae]CAF1454570.1 unnamed protein product [Adineta ricciae]
MDNYSFVWLHKIIDATNDADHQNSITNLRQVVHNVNTFDDMNNCVDFITNFESEVVFLIISIESTSDIIPLIHDLVQLKFIYVLGNVEDFSEMDVKQWSKIKGIYANITLICDSLRQMNRIYDQNTASVGFVELDDVLSTKSLNELDQSFMYTQILKEILLTIDFEREHIDEFLAGCHKADAEKFQKRKYSRDKAIWWYTSSDFIFGQVNKALRNMEVDIIIKMGFLIRDLHENLVALHLQQYPRPQQCSQLVVYRGQGLSQMDLDKLIKGGLISFNNFLSTSTDRSVSYMFAESNADNPDLFGIFFEIAIDLSNSSASFANIRCCSEHEEEDEILFSMHSIFRVTDIKRDNQPYEVNLTLTEDNDPELNALTKYIREETFPSERGWYRLGELLIKMGQFDKALQVYETMLKQTVDDEEKANIYLQLGSIVAAQGKQQEALLYYDRSLDLNQKNSSLNKITLVACYNNVTSVYHDMGQYSQALEYSKKTLESMKRYLPRTVVFEAHSLPMIEKSLEIFQNLPANHPHLAISYNNMSMTSFNIGEDFQALQYALKSFLINKKSLPLNHPDLAISYNNLGLINAKMNKYSAALFCYEKALEIYRETSPNHPQTATFCDNIAAVYSTLGHYSTALTYLQESFAIRGKTLDRNHPDIATSYNCIGSLYHHIGKYFEAISCYLRALEIYKDILPLNYHNLAICYNNIASAYNSDKKYWEALGYYKKTQQIYEEILRENNPDLAIFYNNIASVYDSLDEDSKALLYYSKALDFYQTKSRSPDPYLASIYNNIGMVYKKRNHQLEIALIYYDKSLQVKQKIFPSDYFDFALSYNNIGMVYYKMCNYSEAIQYYQRALEICQSNNLPPDHPYLATLRKNLARAYENEG